MKQTPSTDITVSEPADIAPSDADFIPNAEILTEPMVAHPSRGNKAWQFAVFAVRSGLQFIIMAAVLVASGFLMNQLAESRKERPKRVQKEAVYTVQTQTLQASNNQPTISVYGELVAGRTLNLTSLVNGTVIDVNPNVKIGASIKAGETLIKLNPFPFEIAVTEAEANLKEAEASVLETTTRIAMEETGLKRTREQMQLAQNDLDRAKKLLARKAVTKRTVEERELTMSERRAAFQTSGANIAIQKAQLEARKATVLRLQALVRQAKENLTKTTLTAPFDAVIQATNVELGQTITSALNIITLYEAATLDAQFVLSDGQYGRLVSNNTDLDGRKVNVIWKVGASRVEIPAKIDRVGAEIASGQGGVSVFARLDKAAISKGVRPGAFVSVAVPDQSFDKTFRIPETALFEGDTVYVVGDENRLNARKVTIAAFDGQSVIIGGGLNAGDEVIITQIAEVGEGILIRREGEKTESAKKPSTQPEG
ncbi:MAG: efflux RND transporter periplasmic adaptor subunit [Hyphomicrobiales bacterium]